MGRTPDVPRGARTYRRRMPKISKDTITITDYGPVDDGQLDVDDWSINFTTFKVDIDATPMMKGLPGDHCNCPHWG
jgi:hypothetical protein